MTGETAQFAKDILRQWVFVLAAAPILPGLAARTKSWFSGRKGPPVLQLYWDILKLFRKGTVYSRSTTSVLRAGPVISFSAAMAASLMIPFGGMEAPLTFQGDLILFAYLWGLSRFFTMTAALDTGSAFEGMGASREAIFSCLAEPALLLGFLALAREAGSLSMSDLLSVGLIRIWSIHAPALCLVAAAMAVVFLTENSRIPIDDPNTHLELTMIHEVMVLDHGGPDLALIEYASAVKFFVLGALLVRIVYPIRSGGFWDGGEVLLLGLAALAVLVGVVESTMARFRLSRIPQLLTLSFVLSGFGVILSLAAPR
ncbi:NADH-quinone oxidoreductase subunit H [bacterium]|nr:NADH-quinone oxidoreductase subunit H [bacterium]